MTCAYNAFRGISGGNVGLYSIVGYVDRRNRHEGRTMDATLTMTTPGEMVADYRKVAGLTQAQLGPLVGVTTQMITLYEGNKSNPDRPVVERLDAVLEAGGRILKIYGFTRPGDVDEMIDGLRDELQLQIVDLSRQLDELRSIVQDLRRRGGEDA